MWLGILCDEFVTQSWRWVTSEPTHGKSGVADLELCALVHLSHRTALVFEAENVVHTAAGYAQP